MSLHKEKHNRVRQMLMYEMTLGWSSFSEKGLEKVSQFGWLGAPTNLFSFSLEKLGTVQMNNYGSS